MAGLNRKPFVSLSQPKRLSSINKWWWVENKQWVVNSVFNKSLSSQGCRFVPHVEGISTSKPTEASLWAPNRSLGEADIAVIPPWPRRRAVLRRVLGPPYPSGGFWRLTDSCPSFRRGPASTAVSHQRHFTGKTKPAVFALGYSTCRSRRALARTSRHSH